MHRGWMSNAYLVADEPGGTGVFVDSGAPLEPLLEAVERHSLTVTHLLTTHADADHVAGHEELERRFKIPVVTEDVTTGGLVVRALPTPGHKPEHVSFLVNEENCFTGDALFRDSVGGTRNAFDDLRRSIMDVLMELPQDTRVLPGHADATTIGREWDENPFVRVWRGIDPEGTEPVRVGGEEATLVCWSPDYDGGGKGWVRTADGRDMIVGGSQIERG